MNDPTVEEEVDEHTTRCLLLPNHISDVAEHVLLDGPADCGKTSLLLDAACALVDDNDDDNDDVSVILFRLAQEYDQFPLPCHGNPWNERTMGRIQIRYVSSARELLQFCLTVSRPKRGILVDDFDRIVGDCDDQTKIMILSLMADAANHLRRETGVMLTIIVVTNVKHHLPSFPIEISIKPSKRKNSDLSLAIGDDEFAVGQWVAETRILMSKGVFQTVEYCIVEAVERRSEIRWAVSSE